MKSFFALVTIAVASISVTSAIPVQKRQSGTATYYQPGLGSCGDTDSSDSMIVAVNSADANSNGHCGKSVSITNESTGKTTTAKVADTCPTCSSGDLDLSPAVFEALGGTQDQGVFPISWSMDGGSSGSSGTSSDSTSSASASASASSSSSSSGSSDQSGQQGGQQDGQQGGQQGGQQDGQQGGQQDQNQSGQQSGQQQSGGSGGDGSGQ